MNAIRYITRVCVFAVCAINVSASRTGPPELTEDALNLLLPQAVRFCDVAGVGRVVGQELEQGQEYASFITVEVSDYWHGALPTNTITIHGLSGLFPDPGKLPACVFLAYTNLWFKGGQASPFQRLRWDYMAYLKNLPEPVGATDRLTLFDGHFLIPVGAGDDYEYVAQWVSNLVHAMKVEPDEGKFMSLICEGAVNESSKWAESDARAFLDFWGKAEDKEKLLRWWSDPELPGWLRKDVGKALQDRFQWTPPGEPPQVAGEIETAEYAGDSAAKSMTATRYVVFASVAILAFALTAILARRKSAKP